MISILVIKFKIIKCIDFESIYYVINLDAAISSKVCSEFNSEFLLNVF